jgi:hypothetical protein
MESRLVREKSRVARYGDFTDFSHSKSRFATLAPKMRRQIESDTFVQICPYTQFFEANRMRPYLTGDDITIGRYTAGATVGDVDIKQLMSTKTLDLSIEASGEGRAGCVRLARLYHKSECYSGLKNDKSDMSNLSACNF